MAPDVRPDDAGLDAPAHGWRQVARLGERQRDGWQLAQQQAVDVLRLGHGEHAVAPHCLVDELPADPAERVASRQPQAARGGGDCPLVREGPGHDPLVPVEQREQPGGRPVAAEHR